MVALTPRVIFPALFMYHQTLIADCSDFRCFQIKPCMGESLKKKTKTNIREGSLKNNFGTYTELKMALLENLTVF